MVGVLAVAGTTAAIFAATDNGAQAWEAVDRQVRAAEMTVRPGTNTAWTNMVAHTRQMVDQQLEKGDASGATTSLEQLAAAMPAGQGRDALQAYADQLRKQSRERQARLEEAVSAEKARIGEEWLAAVKTADLDAALARQAALLQELKAASARSLVDEMATLQRMTALWQDALAAYDRGERNRAGQKLRNVAGELLQQPIVPRSAVLERADELENGSGPEGPWGSVDTILQQVTKLEDVPQARQRLLEFSNGNPLAGSAYKTLTRIDGARQLVDEGKLKMALNQLASPRTDDPYGAVYGRLSDEVVLRVMAKQYGQAAVGPPKEGESVEDYYVRIATTLKQEKRWQELWSVLNNDVALSVGKLNHSTWDLRSSDISSIERFLVGRRQEAMGNDVDAVGSYEYVLRTVGRFGPQDEAEARIKAIRERVPDLDERVRAERDESAARRAAISTMIAAQRGRYSPDGTYKSTANPDEDMQELRKLIREEIQAVLVAPEGGNQAPAPSN